MKNVTKTKFVLEYDTQRVKWTDMIKCSLAHNHENTLHGLEEILFCIADITLRKMFIPNETVKSNM